MKTNPNMQAIYHPARLQYVWDMSLSSFRTPKHEL